MVKVLLASATLPKMSNCHKSSSLGRGNDFQQKRRFNYTVALEADKVHRHGNGAIAVPVQSLDVVQQICKELVASFQHAEGHNVVPPHLLHDLAGQSLCPEITWEKGGQLGYCYSCSCSSYILSLSVSQHSCHLSRKNKHAFNVEAPSHHLPNKVDS